MILERGRPANCLASHLVLYSNYCVAGNLCFVNRSVKVKTIST